MPEDDAKKLKDIIEALERLKLRKKELRSALSKEGLDEKDDAIYGIEFERVSLATLGLRRRRDVLIGTFVEEGKEELERLGVHIDDLVSGGKTK